MVTLTNATGVLVAAGTPIYSSGSGAFSVAVATAVASALVVGLLTVDSAGGASGIAQTSDVLVLTTAQWDARTGSTGGLVYNQNYWLDLTAGKLTTTPPATPGQFLTYIGWGLSATQLRLLIQPPIAL